VPRSSPVTTPRRGPFTPRLPARLCYVLGRVAAPNRLWRYVADFLEAHPIGYRALNRAEEAVKAATFGCSACGQCALPHTGYACPMTCPKELRNGPCGGVRSDGGCEVFPGQRCVWVVGYERARAAGELVGFAPLIRPADHRRFGESSWVNYWAGRDEHLIEAPRREGGRPKFHGELLGARE
jgi:hypothetical protein